MPAVTVDNPLTLPRVPVTDPALKDRPVVSLTTAPRGFEGEGFPVRRAFAGIDLRALDPFIMMDQMGEVEYAPGEPRARRGIRTVASKPSRTSSTASSSTPTLTAVVESSPTATHSG